jgi:polar amino acid transport system permease protein
VQEILGAAQAGVSFSFNPTPLTLGALAYLVLFVPVVIFGRWVETRFAWRR